MTALEFAVEMFSRCASLEQVQSQLSTEYDVEVDQSTLSRWRKKHGERIEAKREEFLGEFMDEPLAWRKIRVQKYAGIYHQAMDELNEQGDEKKPTKSKGKSYFYALEALKGIREEMEPIEAQLGRGSVQEVDELIASLQSSLTGDETGEEKTNVPDKSRG